jgi:hypothetical protein
VQAIIGAGIESFGAFTSGSITDWFRRSAVLTQARRLNLGVVGVLKLREVLAAKGPDAPVQLAGDVHTVSVTVTVEDSVSAIVPGLSDAAAQAAGLVGYQVRRVGAARQIRLTFAKQHNTDGVKTFEERWQRNIDSVRDVLWRHGVGPELIDELTERTRVRAREQGTYSDAGDNMWFRILAARVVDEHFGQVREATAEQDSDGGITPPTGTSRTDPVVRDAHSIGPNPDPAALPPGFTPPGHDEMPHPP